MEQFRDFDDFQMNLVEKLSEGLEKLGHANLQMEARNVEKMNGEYDAVIIRKDDADLGVTLNLASAYRQFEDTGDFDFVVSNAIEAVDTGLKNPPIFDKEILTNYEKMKERLSVEVVSAERNADLLEKVPHERMEDMAVVYRIVLDSDKDERASILIRNEHLDMLGITKEQLREDALSNAAEYRPAVIKGMNETLMELLDTDEIEMMGVTYMAPEFMYVASTPDRLCGAGVIAYQNFMDQAAERVGGDFFILPSSIHEILLVPDVGNMEVTDLRSLVVDVNNHEVSAEDKLTDSVYHYDSKEHIFELAEKYEEREKHKGDRISDTREENSTLGKLEKKKEEARNPREKSPELKPSKNREEAL